MKSQYTALKHLQSLPGWEVLESEWLAQVSKIEESRDRAASRGQESAWRYQAGLEKGFKLAMTTLTRVLANMEEADKNLEAEIGYEELLKEVRGEKA